MKIPMRLDYGVRALVELAQHYGEGRVQTAEIAYRQGISEAYLDQVMTTLHKFGFVVSRRGRQGGHMLASDPADIDLGMVMKSLNAYSYPLDCLIDSSECVFSGFCAQQEVWKLVEETIQGLLSDITLADLAQRQRDLVEQADVQA